MPVRTKMLVSLPMVAGGLVLFALLLPSEYKVERSVVIEATPQTVFKNLNNLSRWQKWSAWSPESDPGISNIFGGPEKGVGATYRWLGEITGKGTLVITESIEDKSIRYEMQQDGLPVKTTGSLELQPVANGTLVTWTDEGHIGHNPLRKIIGPFKERTFARYFETGLQGLKKLSENKPVLTLHKR